MITANLIEFKNAIIVDFSVNIAKFEKVNSASVKFTPSISINMKINIATAGTIARI